MMQEMKTEHKPKEREKLDLKIHVPKKEEEQEIEDVVEGCENWNLWDVDSPEYMEDLSSPSNPEVNSCIKEVKIGCVKSET